MAEVGDDSGRAVPRGPADIPERKPRPPELVAVADRKVQVLAQQIARRTPAPGRLLVVGCGSGREAMLLGAALGAETVGVDLDPRFDRNARAAVTLRVMDAEQLEFDDGSFDVVHSFHMLEHVANPARALDEMRRVLAPGGTFCVGTPNRNRLVGYVGAPAPARAKLRYNVEDWRMRARGRWSNEQGAHAGFSRSELVAMCEHAFGSATDITHAYYRALYDRRRSIVDAMDRARLARLLYPCVYVVGARTTVG
jgi:SAM-dependent methyltransferase